jgi:FMN phosphatase YigB (HAD superfamily)
VEGGDAFSVTFRRLKKVKLFLVSPIKAILIDIGGVLWHPPETPLHVNWAARCSLSPKEFDEIVYNSEWSSQALMGKLSGEKMWENIGNQLGLLPIERSQCEEDYWIGRWDTEILDHCRSLRSRYKLGVLSDAESTAREKVKNWINESLFDVIVFSSEVGVCKPDPRVFHCVIEELGVAACETLFIDDREKNVDGAKALGIHAIHYKNRSQVLSAIQEYVSLE